MSRPCDSNQVSKRLAEEYKASVPALHACTAQRVTHQLHAAAVEEGERHDGSLQ